MTGVVISPGASALSPGPFGGIQPPKRMAGRYFIPPHCFISDSAQASAITAAKYYFVPIWVDGNTTFAGAWCYNSGAGDNGKKIKIAAFSEAAAGGPGALAKNFGELTLTGASALRALSSAWTPTIGWYLLALVSDTAPSMYLMQPMAALTNAGFVPNNVLAQLLGTLSPSASADPTTNMAGGGEGVAGVYANFPEANALTPNLAIRQPPLMGLFT